MTKKGPQLDALLKSVSRSFYLSLHVLPPAIRPAMGLGYLLCRTADTIADTNVVPASDRKNLLSLFFNFMDQFPVRTEAIDDLHATFQSMNLSPSSSDGILLSNIPSMLHGLASLSRTDQALVQDIVRAVIQGMRMDLETFGESDDSLRAFLTYTELETYIGWIGGEPGRFWSRVSLEHEPALKVSQQSEWTEKGVQFGTGLQMVNILRDVAEDLRRGRCYIPSDCLREQRLQAEDLRNLETGPAFLPLYHRLIEDARKRLLCGLDYLEKIPHRLFRMRLAVWWPLILGLKTLHLLENTKDVLDLTQKKKISRWSVWRSLTESFILIWSNHLLKIKSARLS